MSTLKDNGKAPIDPPLLEVSAKQKEEDEWKQQLLQLEKEIQSLKSVLNVKTVEAADLKKKLGIGSISEITEDVKHSFQVLSETEMVKKTNAAIRNLGDMASKTYEDVRQSSTVKSIEEKMGSAYSSVKNRISATGVLGAGGVSEGKVDTVDKAAEALYPEISKDNIEELNDDFKIKKPR